MSVSTVVQLPAPAGERWKVSEATPLPPGSEPEPVSETVPRRLAPGSSREAVGAVLSTSTVMLPEVKELPAASVVCARRS